jgi:hypothetical protein
VRTLCDGGCVVPGTERRSAQEAGIVSRKVHSGGQLAYSLRMPIVPSPVPPADGVVTYERLGALLGLAAEYDDLDFKRKLDLSSTRDEVELAKDVGAMQVKGGHIVIGVDEAGVPTGDMDGANTSPFDPANLVPKMQRFVDGSLEIASSVLTKDGHTLVLISVSPNARGCAFFQIDGQYPDPRQPGQSVTVFRAGDVFWRENTRSVRIRREGFEEIIERRFAARRDELLREWAAAQLALATSETASESTQQIDAANKPATTPSFAVPSDQISETGIALSRENDEVGLEQLLDDGRKRVRTYIENVELGEDQLPTLLDSIICLAATFLSYGRGDGFERVIQLLVDAYAATGDVTVVKSFGYSSQISPAAKAPRIWLAIIERVFALGGLAVRREMWKAVRILTTQLPAPLQEAGYERNWLRHALTMASRARQFAVATEGQQQIGLIDFARDDAMRLACLRSDGPSDDEVLTSIAQFDVLSNLAAIDDAHSLDPRVFYTNFARFRQDRIQPVVNRLLTDPAMRADVFRGSDDELAAALAVVGQLATSEGVRFDGFRDWYGTPVAEFIRVHPPAEQGDD